MVVYSLTLARLMSLSLYPSLLLVLDLDILGLEYPTFLFIVGIAMEGMVLVEADDTLSGLVSKHCAEGAWPLKPGRDGLATPGGLLVHILVL